MAALQETAVKVQENLSILGELEKREAQLRCQDKDLDSLGSDLNNSLADLRGAQKAQETAYLENERALKKVRSLGREGLCPTCERPIEGQRDMLMKKYETALSRAGVEKERLKGMVASLTEKIEGVAMARSRLARAFEDLNAKKSQRSALQADLKNADFQIKEIGSELEGIEEKTLTIREVTFDLKRLNDVEAALERMAQLARECQSLAAQKEKMPGKISEQEALNRETKILAERVMNLAEESRRLGYSESQYMEARKKWESNKPLHEQFITLFERIKEIPGLQEKIAVQRDDVKRAARAQEELERSGKDIGFDATEYSALLIERKSLVQKEEEAQKTRISLALEPEVTRNLAEANGRMGDLKKNIAQIRSEIESLAYSSKVHEGAKLDLAKTDQDLVASIKDLSNRRVQLGVLEAGKERLNEEGRRKKEHELKLEKTAIMLEVVETTRDLVNDFMDQVLIRVKNDIAKAASEILEEVSGKYSLLKIDDDFNIQVEDGGSYYPISRYSGGEIDMIAVSVRVAISEYLMRFGPDGESYSFLILDEIFGSQDQEHREKMIQMLRSLEERFPQIIAISHISDVQGQFDNTLLVVEDELGNSQVEAF